ncbi:MAG: hypothetical protein U5K69_29650 [Balneolaceae bacterium]|nr:hypothetical protein [Balneolaceae bacterium]
MVIVTDLFENVDQHEQLISALKHLRRKKHQHLYRRSRKANGNWTSPTADSACRIWKPAPKWKTDCRTSSRRAEKES